MKIFFSYLKRQLAHIGLGVTYISIFFLVLYLYNLPLEAVLYAAILALATGIIFFGVGFLSYLRRQTKLLSVKEQLAYKLAEFPKPRDITEENYQELVVTLFHNLTKDKSAAENANRELNEYYTLWVHQIKTPISAMRLLLQGEESEINTELSLELFKIENYVEMVLHYLRVEDPSSDFVFKKHNLADLVKQAVRKYARMFIRKKINLDLQEFECQVLTDEKWLVFVLEQVLSNAIKYTNKGTISIYVPSSGAKELIIEDSGIGIASEDLPRVFEKGYTGYNGRFDKRSTGIGLYLSKKILTKLSHTISIESKIGEGTKVRIGLDMVDTIIE